MEHTNGTHNGTMQSRNHHHHLPLLHSTPPTTHSSLALISFHGRGLEWYWMWSWTRRVTIQHSSASSAVVSDIHISSQSSEFDSHRISYFFSIPFYLLDKSIVSAMALWPLHQRHPLRVPIALHPHSCSQCISAISRKIGHCNSPPLTLSYVSLENTRPLLRDPFEKSNTATILALIGTEDESAWRSSLT